MRAMQIDIDLSGAIELITSSEAAEIVQNVKTLLLTRKGEVPLDRELGLSAEIIDKPLNIAQARFIAEAAGAIRKYEPRARLKEAVFSGATADGRLDVRIRIDIKL